MRSAAAAAAATVVAVAVAGVPLVWADAPLTLLSDYPTARCLDGSPGGYYYRPAASSSAADKWVFSLQGGGECTTAGDCAGRATGDLGSSASWSDDGSSLLVQFQEDSAERNPSFYDWNHVYVMYCTGDLHLGTVETPGDNQWGWAFFSGALIVDAVIEDLKARQGLGNASTVVWSGDSAGGIGSAALVDHVSQALPLSRVVGAPIAGMYWNNSKPYVGPGNVSYVPFDTEAFRGYADMWQLQLPAACTAVWTSQPWVCALLNYSIPHLESDMFVIEFETDSVQLNLHDGVPEYNDDTAPFVLSFGRTMSTVLSSVVPSLSGAQRGVYAAACFEHTYFDAAYPFVSGENFLSAFASWLDGAANDTLVTMDDCCSGDEVQFNPTCPSY